MIREKKVLLFGFLKYYGTPLLLTARREFYRNILVEFPRVCKNKAFKPETEAVLWSYDKEAFQKWCDGKTGYPIVDAAMRQLNQTGWMHNRLRMV